MFPYPTSYRFYTLAKAGLALAYLWFISDFFRIHLSVWNGLSLLLPQPLEISFLGSTEIDAPLREVAIFLNSKPAVWLLLLSAPAVVALFLWGCRRWIQCAVGVWMSFTMLAMTSLLGMFDSTADIWLNYTLLTYVLTALITSTDDWEKQEPGFDRNRWRENPTIRSTYAWYLVFVQFIVYFYAGVNKLVFGWEPWIHGTALQNLAVDSSMRDYAKGIQVPHLVSLVFCYITLFQRLVVPFGFFFRRLRIWSALILGTMHIGYAILMHVAIFPLVGLSSLLIVVPPGSEAVSDSKSRRKKKERASANAPLPLKPIVAGTFAVLLFLESARMTIASAWPWENKLMLVPAWRMFADGGKSAGMKWRLILQTPQGEIDGTDYALQRMPHLWRDRFYIDYILHTILSADPGQLTQSSDPMLQHLLEAAEKQYGEHQLQVNASPAVFRGRFAIQYPPAISR